MITPDVPGRTYSTRLRTALVLTGSGTAGAYHAGALRALHEAGIKVDLIAGRGAGAVSALFAAIDGGPRLWEVAGIWKARGAERFYGWRPALRAAGFALLAGALALLLPLILLAAIVVAGLTGLGLTLLGLESAGASLTTSFPRWIDRLFAPAALPTIVPRLVLVSLVVAMAVLAAAVIVSFLRDDRRRRSRNGFIWRLFGAPLSAETFATHCAAELWNLIRGAAPLAAPASAELARKYAELLAENLGQPGFRELLVTVHDLDARRDLVFAFLEPSRRRRFFAGPASDAPARRAETFDLAGSAKDHVIDALRAAMAIPLATEPHLVRFAPEGPWRGEAHRVCDRPESLARLIEEAAYAGAEQVILVSAAPPEGHAHELSAGRGDLRGRTGELMAAFETAALRDAIEQFTGRFAAIFVIRPAHNPLAPLDFGGVYDERSDRRQSFTELVDRGYEDAYRQFIEPIVGAGADPAEPVQPLNGGRTAPSQL